MNAPSRLRGNDGPYPGVLCHLDDLLALHVVEVHGPVVHPVGPVLGEDVAGDDAVLVFGDLDELALFADDLALAVFQVSGGGFKRALGVIDGEIGQFDLERELVLLVVARRGFDEADVVEHDLALVHRAFVEDFCRDVFRGKVDALLLCLIQHGGEQAHFELEGEHVRARGAAFAAFGDDLFHK